MRVWLSSFVVAIVFCGTEGLGVSTARAGYIACDETSGVSLPNVESKVPAKSDPFVGSDALQHFVSTDVPPGPTSGTGSPRPVTVDVTVCLCFAGSAEVTSPSVRSKLLIDRSEAPPGNPVLDGILRPPRG
jgi:hypothetical protein